MENKITDLRALYGLKEGERLYTTAPSHKMERSRTAAQIVAALEKRNKFSTIRRAPRLDPATGEEISGFEVIIVEEGNS